MSQLPRARVRLGFTLIELLVVIAIIGVLIGLLLPAVQKVREAASRMRCANNLKQMGLALHAFHDTHNALPNSRRDYHYTWMVQILPYMEQNSLYEQWDLNTTYYKHSALARETPVPSYFCPSRRTSPGDGPSTSGDEPQGAGGPSVPGALADYAGNTGSTGSDYWWTNGNTPTKGVFRLWNNWGSSTPPSIEGFNFTDISDGQSNTLLAGEKHVIQGQFGKGSGGDSSAYNGDTGGAFRGAGPGRTLARTPTDSGNRFGSYHPGVCLFVLGDGSVRSINVAIDSTTLGYLADRADGYAVTVP